MGCSGCTLCQERLRLSWKVDECKPLPSICSMGAASFTIATASRTAGAYTRPLFSST